MATRVVEGKKPYTGGEAIDIDQNKVISLKLRDENNLIIYNSGDDEIYVDLQLPDGITPTDAFPVGVTTGRAVVADGWDKAGTIICAKTTSGDNIKLLYADDGTLWIDNGTGTFKQIYFKADVDALINNLINTKQNGVASATAPSNPSEGDLWYDTTNDVMKVYDGSQWNSIGSGGGGGDVYVSTQANNIFTTGMKIWGGTKSDFDDLVEDSNTAYLILADQPTPPSPGWQPGVNTVLYWELLTDANDTSGNNNDGTVNGTVTWNDGAIFSGSGQISSPLTTMPTDFTISVWVNKSQGSPNEQVLFAKWAGAYYEYERFGMYYNSSNTLYVRQATEPVQGQWLEVGNYGTGSWHNVVLTKTGTTLTVYINGTQTNQFSYCSWADSSASLGIGGWGPSSSGDWNFYGTLNKFIVEDKVRTAQEVADYYDQTKGDYGIS